MRRWKSGLTRGMINKIAPKVSEIVSKYGDVVKDKKCVSYNLDSIICRILKEYSKPEELVAAGSFIGPAVEVKLDTE